MRGLLLWLGMAVALVATAERSVGQERMGAQAVCGVPPKVLASPQANIFNDEQEQWLGEAIADMLEQQYRPVNDPAENAYLVTIGDRLLSVLPPTKMQFHFLLIDAPEINGLSLAGGRVYLTRKLVANARTEDEVAGVLAHEMGHLLTHQVAIETTTDLRRLLGVTSVGDRADVYAKFQRLTEARMHDKHPAKPDDDEKQDVADQVAVYAAAAAGYRAQAYAEFWDRSFFVNGKTGNGLGDFFGTTKPTEKRLRGMRKLTAALPPGCGAGAGESSVAFQQWHGTVVANQSSTGRGNGQSPAEVSLAPPLRMDLENVRFSRDGKLVLAQDESSISVVNKDPLRVLFRIDAERAMPAKFSPDSSRVVFSTPDLHVEEWSVAEQKLVAAHEVVTRQPCLQTELSPDGRTLICVIWNEQGNNLGVELVDVGTGEVVFEKKSWFEPVFALALRLALNQSLGIGAGPIPMSMSADGNAVLMGYASTKVAFDLKLRTQIKIGGELKSETMNVYAFTGPDQVMMVNTFKSADSGLVSFPDGRRLKRMDVPLPNMEQVTKGNYVLVHDLKDFALGVADFSSGKFVVGSQATAMDVWEDMAVSEGTDGTLLLGKLLSPGGATLTLPITPLGRPVAAAVSPGGRYLAMSTRTRGGVWDTTTGKRLYLLRPFRSVWWSAPGKAMLEMEKYQKVPLQVAELGVEPKTSKIMPYSLEKDVLVEAGRLLEWKQEPKKQWRLEARDMQTNEVVWSRVFPDNPAYTENLTGDELIFSSFLKSDEARAAVRTDVALRAKLDATHDKAAARVVEMLDPRTGEVKQKTLIEVPGSYQGVGGVAHVGDLLYVHTADNRTVVYSLSTGQQVRQMFGEVVAVDAASGRVCAANRRGEAVVYDGDGRELKHLRLESPLRFASLQETGKALVVLTADQRVRRFTVDGAPSSFAVAAGAQ